MYNRYGVLIGHNLARAKEKAKENMENIEKAKFAAQAKRAQEEMKKVENQASNSLNAKTTGPMDKRDMLAVRMKGIPRSEHTVHIMCPEQQRRFILHFLTPGSCALGILHDGFQSYFKGNEVEYGKFREFVQDKCPEIEMLKGNEIRLKKKKT